MEAPKFAENVGFSVVASSVDNHPAKRSFYKNKLCDGTLKPCISHPCRPNEPFYPLFDMTHNIKNVFNNMERRKIFNLPPLPLSLSTSLTRSDRCTITQQPFTANFNHIQDVYQLESDKPVKVAHKLKKTCFNPSSIEKTSVKFAAAVFHESTHNALTHYSSTSPNRRPWVGTAAFLQLFSVLWNVVNVRTPRKGDHKRNEAAKPITSPVDWKLKFLEDFSDYLTTWQQSGQPGLSQETFLALKHTLSALASLSRYLLTSKFFHYVLLGFMLSDNLESRFGWYRQLAVANYFISLRQVRESEKKIRIISLLQQSGFSVSEASIGIGD
jgi:hypothetical protein